MEVYVKLSEMTSTEFEACFRRLSCVEKKEFVINRRKEIVSVTNIEILTKLCENGFYEALLQVIKVGNKAEILNCLNYVYGEKSAHPYLGMSKEDEEVVLKFIANNLYLADFMYNKVHFLLANKTKSRWIENVIFNNASIEVLEFLFNNIAKDKVIISKSIGDVLLEKGSVYAIKNYVQRVKYLSVKQSYITISAFKKFYAREDLGFGEKRSLTYFLLNRLEISYSTVYKIRKLGFID